MAEFYALTLCFHLLYFGKRTINNSKKKGTTRLEPGTQIIINKELKIGKYVENQNLNMLQEKSVEIREMMSFKIGFMVLR